MPLSGDLVAWGWARAWVGMWQGQWGLGERGHMCVCDAGGSAGVVIRWGLCDLQ